MHVLSISTDRNVFDDSSAVQARALEYAKALGSVDTIVFSRLNQNCQKEKIVDKLSLYATRSRSRWLYIVDAIKIAKTLTKPDVVTTQDPFESGLAGFFIANHFKVPLHVQVHTDLFSPEFAKHSWLNRARLVIARIILKKAQRVRVVSERIKELIEDRNITKSTITVLPIFVDVEKYRGVQRARHERFNPMLLVVSRLEKEKNVSLALETLKILREGGEKEAGLVVVGQGSEAGILTKKAKALGVNQWFECVGWRDPLPYYAMADVMLFPSLYDGYGMVIVEALASGVPVVANDVGVARESGSHIAANTPRTFAHKIVEILSEGKRGELKNYPYSFFEEYVMAYAKDLRATI